MADIKLKAVHSILMSKGRSAEPGALFHVEESEGEHLLAEGAAVRPGQEPPAIPTLSAAEADEVAKAEASVE
jgi:hypothetical protein